MCQHRGCVGQNSTKFCPRGFYMAPFFCEFSFIECPTIKFGTVSIPKMTFARSKNAFVLNNAAKEIAASNFRKLRMKLN